MGTSRVANTQVEGLTNLIQDLAVLKTAPDADVAFITSLETQILQYLKQPMQNLAGQMPPSNPMTGSPGMPPGQQPMQPPMSLPSTPMGSRGGPGTGMSGGAPPMDEIRRMVG